MGIFDSKVLNPNTPASPKVLDQMRQSLATPEARAALLQFGVSMLTPQWGGFGAALSQSVGNAGEAVGRVQAADAKQARAEQTQAYQEQSLDARKKAIDQAGEIALAKLEAAKQKQSAAGGIPASVLFGAKQKQTQQYANFYSKRLDNAPYEPGSPWAGLERAKIASDPAFKQAVDAEWAASHAGTGADATASAAADTTQTAQPAQGAPAASAGPANRDQIIAQAREAIAAGKSKAAVLGMLKSQYGIDDPGL